MSFSVALPNIIQGGMGAGVSNWRLAKTVSEQGALGVVSGIALDTILARRLQLGDIGGHMRRALSHFPWPDMAERILEKYFIANGKAATDPFKLIPVPSVQYRPSSVELTVVGNFVEMFLAKEGHDGVVGVNYLDKIQLPTMASLLGAMLAKVDAVLMGAGIPRAIPGILDKLFNWEPVDLRLYVEENREGNNYAQHFDPKEFFPEPRPKLKRPFFMAIVSSEVVATVMVRKASGEVNGLIIENHTAGGHNAPPRKTDKDNPKFTERDIPNLEKIKALGLPYWLAGSFASPEKLQEAMDGGAAGIQVGTAFGYCDESGIDPDIKHKVINSYLDGSLNVSTDFRLSPTGYPFKSVTLEGITVTEEQDKNRTRLCDLGYLRTLYSKEESRVGLGYRCPSEPVDKYLKKGGVEEDTVKRQCLCNGLLATIGMPQVHKGKADFPIITAGENFSFLDNFVTPGNVRYHAKDVLDYLWGRTVSEESLDSDEVTSVGTPQ